MEPERGERRDETLDRREEVQAEANNMSYCEELGFCSNENGKSLKNFEQGVT